MLARLLSVAALALFCAALVVGSALRADDLPLLGVGTTKTRGAAYAGPGDVPGVGSAQAFWSCTFAYKATTAVGTNACLLADALTGTTHTFQLQIQANGQTNWAAAQTDATCTGTGGCVVKTMNDQTGNGQNCTQGTLANMPPFLFSAVGSFPAVNPNGTGSFALTCTAAATVNTPWTITMMGQINTSGHIFAWNDSQAGPSNVGSLAGNSSAFSLEAGSSLTSTVADTANHAVTGLWSTGGTGAVIRVDTTETTGGTNGPTITSTDTWTLASYPSLGIRDWNGLIGEIGIWSNAFTTGAGSQAANMNANIHTRWGF